MGWPEEQFEKILAADGPDRATLLEELVSSHKETREWLHLDLKEVPGEPKKPTQGDLAQEVSGFANEDGGLIVWGFEDFDNGGNPKPLADAAAFVEWLVRMAPESTVPTVPDVRSVAALLEGGKGYAVTLVGRSDRGPHRAHMGPSGVKDLYFRRRSERTGKMSHAELEDMFGRRPHPLVLPEILLLRQGNTRKLEFSVCNIGKGTAHWAGLRISVRPYDPQRPSYHLPHRLDRRFQFNDGEPKPDEHSCVILPSDQSASVLHPGMQYTYACAEASGVAIADIPPQVEYSWCTLAEGMRERRGTILLKRGDFARIHPQCTVVARWEAHPLWGEPVSRIPL